MCNSLRVPQSLPVSPTLETSSTRPSCQAFPLSSSARPQAAHYLVRWLVNVFLHPAMVTHGLQGVVPSDCWDRMAAFLIFHHQWNSRKWISDDSLQAVSLSSHCFSLQCTSSVHKSGHILVYLSHSFHRSFIPTIWYLWKHVTCEIILP